MPQHSELTKDNSFRVFIGSHKLAFAKVSGLGGEMEKEVYAEGGGISYPHVMPTPKTSLRSMTMERGLQTENHVIRNIKPGVFIPWIEIIVMGVDGMPYYEFFLEEAWVTKWDVLDLDAMDGRVLIDTFEIEYVRSKRESLR